MKLMPAMTLLFLYLKLTHQIDWSYWWVWLPVIVAVIVEIVAKCVEVVIEK